MRRLVMVCVVLFVPLLAAGQILPVVATGAPAGKATPGHTRHTVRCVKGKQKVKKGGRRLPACRKTRTPTPRPTSTPTRHHKKKPKPAPTHTPTPSPIMTATPTDTPTPAPSVATLSVSATAPAAARVAFYACDIPTGVTVLFSPAPAITVTSSGPPYGSAAVSTLTATTDPSVAAGQYVMAVLAYEQTPGGASPRPVAVQDLSPHAVTLTVSSGGVTSLAPSSAQLPVTGTTCSQLPAGFAPTPTPTPAAGDVTVTAAMTPANPSPNAPVTVTGSLLVSGRAVPGLEMRSKWYTQYGIKECDAITDQNGVASCTLPNADAWPGYSVVVQVIFSYIGQDFVAYTSYTE